MDTRLFHKRLLEAVRASMPAGAGVVCAVSGGADSVALLHGLCTVNQIHRRGWRLRVAHLHHGLRAAADDDAAFVRNVAGSLGLGCTVEAVDVSAEAGAGGGTIEETGRDARYAFLERVAVETGAGVVAVAHHADDQAETVLHRIVRGTGLHGLAGMPARRPISATSAIELVRPLLGFRRAELRAYLATRGLGFREDATNADLTATRNRIRHAVLPLLEQTLNPQVVTALTRLATQARCADEALRSFAQDALNHSRIRRDDRSIVWSAAAVAGWPRLIQTEVIRAGLRQLGVGLQDVGFERLEAAARLAAGDGKRCAIEFPGGVLVERRGQELRMDRSPSSVCDGVIDS